MSESLGQNYDLDFYIKKLLNFKILNSYTVKKLYYKISSKFCVFWRDTYTEVRKKPESQNKSSKIQNFA